MGSVFAVAIRRFAPHRFHDPRSAMRCRASSRPFIQRNGLSCAIFDGVVGKDYTMDRNHSLVFLDLNTNAIVDEDGTGDFNGVGKKLHSKGRGRTHWFLSMLYPPLIAKADSFRFAPTDASWGMSGVLKLLKRMARPEGLEPPTLCFEGRCSIQLSYGRIFNAL
jgi:hypothetical protein